VAAAAEAAAGGGPGLSRLTVTISNHRHRGGCMLLSGVTSEVGYYRMVVVIQPGL
jgi:hypothetical protein